MMRRKWSKQGNPRYAGGLPTWEYSLMMEGYTG